MKTKIKLEEHDHDIKPIAVRAFAVVISFFVVWLVAVLLLAPIMKDFEGIGAFGDAFGVINALFSGLALAAVAVTLWLSLKQLKVQQAELKENTEALQGQREQLEIHNKFLTKQSVQNQFFQIVESWQTITHNLEFRTTTDGSRGRQVHTFTGRAAMVKAASALLQQLRIEVSEPANQSQEPGHNQAVRRTLIEQAYGQIAMSANFHLGNYFRLFYHIIRLVHIGEVLTQEEKRDLARVLRAHLSESELVMLFYNCVLPFGEKLHPLVEEYDLLQNHNRNLITQEIDLDFFPVTKARWEAAADDRTNE